MEFWTEVRRRVLTGQLSKRAVVSVKVRTLVFGLALA